MFLVFQPVEGHNHGGGYLYAEKPAWDNLESYGFYNTKIWKRLPYAIRIKKIKKRITVIKGHRAMYCFGSYCIWKEEKIREEKK